MSRRIWTRLLVLLLLAALEWFREQHAARPDAPAPTAASTTAPNGTSPAASPATALAADAQLARAFETHARDLRVEDQGVVARILPDDTDGSRHQRFIVRLGNGQTVLIAHNIDLAPRVEPLRTGETVVFNGEYEWSPQGGVVHWTHHDPSGRHVAGWIRVGDRLIQ